MLTPAVNVDKNLKEQNPHGTYDFPIDIHENVFSRDRHSFFSCHWHPEIELALMLEGSMHYQVNSREYVLHAGDVCFINANSLHMGSLISREAHTLSLIFHPRILYGYEEKRIQDKYVDPVLESSFSSCLLADSQKGTGTRIFQLITESLQLFEKKSPAWELFLKGTLLACWAAVYTLYEKEGSLQKPSVKAIESGKKAREILNYIHQNYTRKITLDEIARSASLSPGECGRLCKRVFHQTPFEYLNSYRIEQSLPDLLAHELSITEIALKNGFSGSSYYTETFKAVKGISPSKFRHQFAR